jgi:subtilisin-like proprotein convertase family protein/endonuclease/exonuclease/phosphatase family metal-dependent hydrolase
LKNTTSISCSLEKGFLKIFNLFAFILLLFYCTSAFAAPIADFTANSQSACTGQSVTFTNASTGNITSYSWNFGSGASPATASSIGPHSIAYSTSGQKTITLTVNGPDGPATITKTNYITVNSAAPVLSGSITGNSSVCLNAQGIQYSIASNAAATSYNWTAQTGSSITGQGTNNISVNFASTSGNVCVTASNGCGTSNQLCKSVSVGKDRVKIMTYNLLNYPDNQNGSISVDTSLRNPFYRTTIASADPDILVIQELLSSAGYNGFLSNVMNQNGNVYSAATYINSFDTDNGLFYKTTKFHFVSNTPIQTDLRDINEFKLVHILSGDTIRIYSVHLKASNTPSDENQRALEVDSLRKVTNQLAPGSDFLVCGDYNIYYTAESAYQKLIAVTSGVEGQFVDALSLTGTWNNPAYSIYHTQSPRTRAFGGGTTGGLDDRFDMILFSKAISLTGGMSYVSGSMTAYGNDGNHYNDSINHPPNAVVSQAIADALHYGSDHIPVFASFEFENSSCAYVDVGATDLITPVTPTCSDPAQPLQVQVKNFGASQLNFANTNLQVVLDATNPASGTQTFTQTVSTGSLNAGSVMTVTFNSLYDMSSTGTYTFNAHTVFPGDTTSSDNAMPSKQVTVYQNTTATISPSGPVNICSGNNTLLTANTGSNVTYQWQKNSVNISGATSQNYSATQSGNYTVTMQKTNTITTNYPSSTFSNLNSYSIPDNSCTGATSTINVSGYIGTVSSSGITAKINISHPNIGDLVIYLEAPNGDRLGLASRVGSTGDNFVNTQFSDAGPSQLPSTGAPYTNTYKPWTVLLSTCSSSNKLTFASINAGSINPNGNWKLLVFDRSGTNTGNISSWQITFPSYSVNSFLVCDPVISSAVTVNVQSLPVVTFNPASPAVCSGAAVNITANGANTYTWSPSSGLNVTTGSIVTANPSVATTYTVTGTSIFGCTTTTTLSVAISQNINVTLNSFSDVCVNANSFTLTGGSPAGGVYSGAGVSNGVFSPSVAGAGNHTITYTYDDGSGCGGSATSNIFVSPTPDATISPAGPISLCTGNSVTLSVPASSSYAWSNGINTQNNLISSAGSYSVIVTNANGCTSSSTPVSVTVSPFQATGILFTETMGSAAPSPTAISTYETNNNFDNDNFTMSGTADVRSTLPSQNYTGASAGANIFFTTTAGKNFLISGINTSGLTNLVISFGIYKSTTASDGSDFQIQVSSDGVNFTPLTLPLLPTGSGTSIWQYETCSGTIPATGNLRIQFIQNSTTTQYRIDDLKMTYTVTSPVVNASGPTDICQGNSVTLTATSSNSYLWNNGATTQSIIANATSSYFCSITSENGCLATTNTINVNVRPALFTVTGGGGYCSGGNGVAVGLNGSENGVTYQLKIGAGNSGSPLNGNGNSLTFGNKTTAGTYTVVATNTSAGCTATMTGSAIVSVNPLPAIFGVTGGGSYCQGGNGVSINLSNSTNGIKYDLLLDGNLTGVTISGTGSGISFDNITTSGNYTVLATNISTGCTQTMSGSANISINQNPSAFNVTGGGSYCINGTGVVVGISNSENNIQYQLKLNNINTGSPINGNGNSLSFGNQTGVGAYSVFATNTITGCTATMNNTVTVDILPNPQLANVTGGGNYCSVPGDGVAVGLSNSENNVNYQLYVNTNTPSGLQVSGNGFPLSFGNQSTAGNYTVIATNSATMCSITMSGSVNIIRDEATSWYRDVDNDGYGNASDLLSACIQPAGYIVDNSDCNDQSSTVNPGAIEICGNGIDDNCNNQVDENCGSVSLHLKVFIEGFYIGNGTLNAVADPVVHPTICDTVKIELHDAISPYAISYSVRDTIDTNGYGLFIFPAAIFQNSYYIVVKHRNCIETWSKTPVSFNTSDVYFDFTHP